MTTQTPPVEPQCKEYEDAALIHMVRNQWIEAAQCLGKAIATSRHPMRQRMYAQHVIIAYERAKEANQPR